MKYSLYKNDYIQFKYPETWVVKTSIEKDTLSEVNISSVDGLYFLKVGNLADWHLDEAKYDLKKPNVLTYVRGGIVDSASYNDVMLENLPLYVEIPMLDTYLFYFPSIDSEERQKELRFFEKTKDGLFLSSASNGEFQFQHDSYQIFDPNNIGTLNLNCEINDESNFKICVEFITKFFESVKAQ